MHLLKKVASNADLELLKTEKDELNEKYKIITAKRQSWLKCRDIEEDITSIIKLNTEKKLKYETKFKECFNGNNNSNDAEKHIYIKIMDDITKYLDDLNSTLGILNNASDMDDTTFEKETYDYNKKSQKIRDKIAIVKRTIR